jgi:hypothetical protein
VVEPTTLPWGNRSLLARDPDGNVVIRGVRFGAVHHHVQQAGCLCFVLGRTGHGEDADEADRGVLGGEAGAGFARRPPGIEDFVEWS